MNWAQNVMRLNRVSVDDQRASLLQVVLAVVCTVVAFLSGCATRPRQPSLAVVLWGHSGGGAALELFDSQTGHVESKTLSGNASRLAIVGQQPGGATRVCAVTEPIPFRYASVVSMWDVSQEGMQLVGETTISPKVNFVFVQSGQLFVTQRNELRVLSQATGMLVPLATLPDDVMSRPFAICDGELFLLGWTSFRDQLRYLYSVSLSDGATKSLGAIRKQRVLRHERSIEYALADGSTKTIALPKNERDVCLEWPEYSLSSKPSTTYFSFGEYRSERRAEYPVDLIVVPRP